jgi:DNA mismatch repair ATPase MutS
MKALLMHRDRDFNREQPLPDHAAVLTQDMELETLLQAMAGGDEFLHGIARTALFAGLANDVDTILYRQAILQDCLAHSDVILELYGLAIEARESRKKYRLGVFCHSPASVLYDAIELLTLFLGLLRKLRGIAEREVGRFQSEGFRKLFAMLVRELGEDYLAGIEDHLNALKFRGGMLVSARVAEGNEAAGFVLHRPQDKRRRWLDWIFGEAPSPYTFHLHERDEAGARILGDLRQRGINTVANVLGQSAEHIQGFFEMLRTELAFYVGCLNLHARLAATGEPVCFPQPAPVGTHRHRFTGLYDACLALHLERRVVGNTADAEGKNLIVITGANQGGKSSFLRAIGLAQLMMQAGMFVSADAFAAELVTGLFTHYKREEDTTMEHGKFDEELARLSGIVDQLSPHALLLFNESFASTNEREGSEVARQVVYALLEKRIKVFFVTHLYDFARGCYEMQREAGVFLRAERLPDGTRSFRLVEGEPETTSHGDDLYRSVFADEKEETPTD